MNDTVLQRQDSKFEPWRSEAEHATSRSRRLPTILSFTRGWGRNIFAVSNCRDRELNSAVLTTTLGPPPSFALNIRCADDRLRNKFCVIVWSIIFIIFYNDIFTSHLNNALKWEVKCQSFSSLFYRWIYHLNRATLTFFMRLSISSYTGYQHTNTVFAMLSNCDA